ncbi:hypothetical protein [Geodermatophilus sp. CPCC 205761]|uniref:hypothetical protein n=1 Tax=Geodermatophilus sp. CPCC 205761 TaxID=2936597 RepID=UPI003EF03EFC
MSSRERDTAVYNALLRTAMAAVNAGWLFSEWHTELSRRASGLGMQVATKRNGEDRPAAQVQKTLQRVWDRAVDRVEESPPLDEAGRAAYVAEFRTWLAEPGCPVSDNQRIVLDAVARRAAELKVTSPNCPRRYLTAATGLGLTALRTALRQCIDRGLLVQVEKGQAWAKGRKRENCRAAVYRLPAVESLPRANQCPASGASGAPPTVPPPVEVAEVPLTSGAPQPMPSAETVPGPLPSGAPPSSNPPPEEQVTLNELAQAHALITQIKAEVLGALRVELGLVAPDRSEATVRPLRVVRGEAGA